MPFFVVFLGFTAVGALVAAHRPTNAIGWPLLAQGLLWELAGVAAGYANDALVALVRSAPAAERSLSPPRAGRAGEPVE